MITYSKNLNVTPGEYPKVIKMNQYDSDFVLVFTLYSSIGELAIESDSAAAIRGTKRDGNGFSALAAISGNTVTVNGDVQMTACAGENVFEIVVYKVAASSDETPSENKVYYTRTGTTTYVYTRFTETEFDSEETYYEFVKELSTANFILDVERAVLDKDTIPSESKIRELIDVIDRTDEIIAAAQQAEDAVDEVNGTLQGLVNDAVAAKEAAESAAAAAAEDTATELQSTFQGLVDDAVAAKEAAESAAAAAAEETAAELNTMMAEYAADALEQRNIAQTMAAYTAQDYEAVHTKAEQIARLTTDADTIARQALEKAGNAENEAAETANTLSSLRSLVNEFRLKLESKFDDAYLENGYQYFTSDGVVVVGPLGPFAGGGGGGGGGDTNHAVLTVTNTTGWLSKTIAAGTSCEVTLSWSSIEDEMPTGNGTMRITVNGIVKTTQEVEQGNLTVDLAPYCGNGANVCKVQVSDIYGNARTINFSITVSQLSITSSFDTSTPYQGAILFPYTPVGSLLKTVYFVLDGTTIGTQQTSVSNRQMSYTIAAQSHGAHTLEVYFECEVNNEIVESNRLYFEFMALDPLSDDIIITSSFSTTTVAQYDSLQVPFRVYDPTSATTEIKLYLNDNLISTQTVDRTEQTYTLRANVVGANEFKIEAGDGEFSKILEFSVTETSVDVSAETEDLALYLNAQGRSNNEETRNVWSYNDISATFTDFNWALDGWQKDSDGIDVLRLVDDARVTIPYKIFQNDFKSTGKTIEIEFATREVSDYSTTLLSCWTEATGDNIGLKITPQSVTFKGAQTEISTVYKENEHVRLSIVIQKQTEYRLILIYINGIMSRAIQYASGERFSQLSPVNISIGSNDCGIDLYNIRVYDNDLNEMQVLDNWIADTQIGSLMVDRYMRNHVYNQSGEVTIATLPSDLPYMIIEAVELPQYKGDKKTVSGSFVYPGASSRSFTFEGCQINVQGTSSAVYYRKNYDLQFKQGFIMQSGVTADNYQLLPGVIPFDRFVLKADVASSESANNTVLTMFYNDSCPYRTPAMQQDSRVRYGIAGFPIVLFWYNPDNQTTTFLGKHNFNLPKRAPAPYGYSGNMESWEWERNNSSNVKFQDNDFTTMAYDALTDTYYPEWYDDFEARFPSDEWRDYTKLNEFLSWVKSTWQEAATDDDLDESVTYHLSSRVTVDKYPEDESYTVVPEVVEGQATGWYDITFTKDTAAYRLSKFRAEASDYMELQSAFYYYLFTEMFLMIDSRAKNMFVGFDGSEIE